MLAANTKVTGLGFTAFPVKHDQKTPDNNCLISAVCGNATDPVGIRKQLTKLVGDQIQKYLDSSSKEEKAIVLNYLDFCYDLGTNRTINDHFDNTPNDLKKLKALENRVIRAIEDKISRGAVLDMVFAGQVLANLINTDIIVSSKLDGSLIKYHLKSESNTGHGQSIKVRLVDEHFTGAIPAYLSLNRVETTQDSKFFASDQGTALSTIQFIVSTVGGVDTPLSSAKYQPQKAVVADANREQAYMGLRDASISGQDSGYKKV